jgi:hypothetical protein
LSDVVGRRKTPASKRHAVRPDFLSANPVSSLDGIRVKRRCARRREGKGGAEKKEKKGQITHFFK